MILRLRCAILWRFVIGALLALSLGGSGEIAAAQARIAFLPPAPAITPENADQIVRRALIGKGSPENVTFSPDGAALVVTASAGITFYDARTLAEQRFIATPDRLTRLAFAPDGASFVAGVPDGTVNQWRIADGALIATFSAPPVSRYQSVAFSPDGATVAAGSADGKAALWRVSDGALLLTLAVGAAPVSFVAFSPDSTTIATTQAMFRFGGSDNALRVWHVADGSLAYERSWGLYEGSPLELDSTRFLKFTMGPKLEVWEMNTQEAHRTAAFSLADLHSSGIALAIAPDGSAIATGYNGKIQIRDASNGAVLETLALSARGSDPVLVTAMAFSPDSGTLASLAADGMLRRWHYFAEFDALQTVADYTPSANRYQGRVEDTAISPDGSLFASTSRGDGIQMRHIADGTVLYTLLLAPNYGAIRIAFSADGAMLAAAEDDGTARLWRVSDGTPLAATVGLCKISCTNFAYAVFGDMVAVAGQDGPAATPSLRVLRISDGTLLQTLSLPTTNPDTMIVNNGPIIQNLMFSPDGGLLAATTHPTTLRDAETVRIWRVADGTLLQAFSVLTPPLLTQGASTYTVAFTPDGMALITSVENAVTVWRVSDGAVLRSFAISGYSHAEGYQTGYVLPPGGITFADSRIESIGITPDGQMAIFGVSDDTLQLWRLSDGTLVRTLPGSSATSVTFAADGSLFVTGSRDGTIRVWGMSP